MCSLFMLTGDGSLQLVQLGWMSTLVEPTSTEQCWPSPMLKETGAPVRVWTRASLKILHVCCMKYLTTLYYLFHHLDSKLFISQFFANYLCCNYINFAEIYVWVPCTLPTSCNKAPHWNMCPIKFSSFKACTTIISTGNTWSENLWI